MTVDNLENLSKLELIGMVKKLQMSDNRFQSLVEHTSDALFCYEYNPPISIDLPIEIQVEMFYNGVLVECNDIAAKTYGYSQASEVLGKSLTELFKAVPGSLDDFFRSFIERGYRTINAEASETLEDGSKRYFLNNGHAVIANRHVERVWGAYHEITEIKEVEEKLRESEQKFRLFIEALPQPVWIYQDYQCQYANPAAERTTGYSIEELAFMKFWDFLHSDYKTLAMEGAKNLEKSGSPSLTSSLVKIITKSGDERWLDARLELTEYEGRRAVLVSAMDITERREAEKVRRELEHRRDNFIWMASHELRTPLTVIIGYIDFLEDHLGRIEPDRQEKIFEAIRNSLTRLERLTDDVSIIAQLQRGVFTTKLSDFEFCTFFSEITGTYYNLLGEQFEFFGCQTEDPILIKGDKDRLQQVFDNLINNAVNHTHPKQRLIKFKLEVLPVTLRIEIVDNGAGIAPENLDKIFDQFVSFETEFSASGTGIGLFISHKILEAHKGSIMAQSEGLGKGSTFIITLPRF
ncbi:MAG: PAS domain-containing sensor histidine kinase [Candidatus Heimdallarchaeota archaeon]|nr:MAG: PAS domain-containing sensor histidine kinase [Candidatus Heimdallarchaeota archaeon]